MNEVSIAIGMYTAWSLYRDGRWLVKNAKRLPFHLGRATRALVGPSRHRPKRHDESTGELQGGQQSSLPPALEAPKPVEPPKPPSFSELKPQAAMDYIMSKPNAERGPLLAEAIRDGRIELDADSRPVVAGTKAKKRR